MPIYTDRIDCKVTVQEIPMARLFSGITRVMFRIEWITVAAEFAKFGADNALTNGINIKYLGSAIFSDNIKSLADIMALSYDYNIDSDGAGMTVFHFTSRLTFGKFNDLRYLSISKVTDLVVDINDDLSGSGNAKIHLTFEGF